MKRVSVVLVVLFAVLIGAGGCTSEEDTAGVVTLEGQVLNAGTNEPVSNAFITVMPYNLLFETNSDGKFNATVEIDSTMNLQLRAAKTGYATSAIEVLALAGRTITVPTMRLLQTTEGELVSGRASNVMLLKQSTQTIGVKESGSEEVAQITFQVADSSGRPVVLDKSVDVRFSLGQQPGGGEFIFPTSGKTDNNGQIVVNLSSGTKAGVVQIVAEANVAGRTLRSLPVSVAIHGGLPDQPHFSLGPQQFNFPGLRSFGILNPVSVVVGDKYGNPVKPGTAVYFTTSHGVVEGSVLTNAQGRGTVNLISANPLPPDGIGIITATTADENRNEVKQQIPVVFSGVPIIQISPSVAQLGQEYRLTVSDQNNNPLAQGTTINVRVEGTKVKAVGNTAVKLDDTAFIGGMKYENVRRGPGITEFRFRAAADLSSDTEEGEPIVEAITITVSGPNGNIEIMLGKGAPMARMNGVRVQTRADGSATARLAE